jgi:DNA-binding response OmpR family regulator/tetratricopeptide (TPR) repeat protein
MALKILIAEDDRHTRKILEHIFTKDPAFAEQDTQLFLAPDGEEALRIFEREEPDLVISDLLMPRLDGFALCRAIRKTPQGKDVPLIVTSAIYKETALLNKMREELQVEFFAKPFQVRELLRGVQRMLERQDKKPRPSAQGATQQAKPSEPKAEAQPPTRGSLSDRPLAALIFDILEARSTGKLTLRRGRLRKEIYFVLGHPIGAESNVRTESLGHYLVVKRILDSNQHNKLLATARQESTTVMQALATLGWLSEDDVLRHHTALVKLRIINSLRWSDGRYEFTPGDTFSERMPRCAIEPATIVLLGLRRVIDLDEATQQLQPSADRPLVLTLRGERYRDVFIKVFGADLLNYLPTRPSIHELSAKGLEGMTIYSHAYALLHTGMARLGAARREPSAPALPGQDPLGLDQLKHAATQDREKQQPQHDEVIYQELFGVDEISVVTAMPIEPQQEDARQEDSGVVEIPIAVDESTEAGPQPALSAEQARKELVSTYLGIHQKTYYEVLGVGKDASPEEIEQAFEAKVSEFSVEKYSELDLGTDHPKLEEILHIFRQARKVLTDPASRAEYDRSIATRASGKADPLEAELRFKEGEQRLRDGRLAEAAQSFRQALDIDPEVADYHAYLAWTIYASAPSKSEVLPEVTSRLDQALDMNPDLESAHLFYGKLAAEQANPQKAVEHLERVLDTNPGHVEAFEKLFTVLSSRGDWRVLERLHRKVIHRLGKRFPDRALTLWKSLASIYEEKLENTDGARTCLEIAAKIAPRDTDVRKKLEEISRPSPESWKEIRSRVTKQWEKSGPDKDPIEELFDALVGHRQFDEAYACSAVLAAMGSQHPRANAYHARYRPPFLQRVRRDLDETVWRLIRHPDDDPDIGRLFSALEKLPEDIDLGLEPDPPPCTEVDLGSASNDFAAVVSYLCEALRQPVPPVAISEELPEEQAVIISISQPRLVVSQGLFEEKDRLRLAGALTPPLTMLRPGRKLAGVLETPKLKTLLMATMMMVAPKLKAQDPHGEISATRDRLSRAPRPLKEELAKIIMELTRQRTSLNIGRWYRGLLATSRRAALLMVGDLADVLEEVSPKHRSQALADLGLYALCDEHFQARRRLGISVAV